MRYPRTLGLTALVLLATPWATLAQQADTTVYDDAKVAFGRMAKLGTQLPLAVTGEVEPNDSTATATLVVLGDTASGVIDPAGDVDFFAIDLLGGQLTDFDVDASQFGSFLDPILTLYDTDGVTVLRVNDDFDGLDSRIQHAIPSDGRYFLSIIDFGTPDGGPGYTYTINFNFTPPPPGDPTTLFAADIGWPAGIVADQTGDLIVGDRLNWRLVRVDATGTVTDLNTEFGFPTDVDIDGFGDFLVSGFNYFGQGGVVRISPDGQRVTQFALGPNLNTPSSVVVGPDGDVWVGYSFDRIVRHNPAGTERSSIDISGLQLFDMAFSPAGELHFSTFGFGSVYRVEGDTLPVLVLTTGPFLEGLAFDVDGRLYVANGFLGQVSLYDATYAAIAEPFARSNLSGPIHLAFGRDATGAMTSRVFAGNQGFGPVIEFAGGIVELNNAGIPAVGFRRPDLSCQVTQFWGDVDADGAVNSRDALVALTSAVGMDVSGFDLTYADVDQDGTVTTRDALFIMSFGIGLNVAGSFTGGPADASCTAPAAARQIAGRP